MDVLEWLKHFLYDRTTDSVPDGRPLYAYKCSDKDYGDLKLFVSNEFKRHVLPDYSITFPHIFCLYAAETWRRSHVGGPWKWETVFSEVTHFVPDHHIIVEWVRKGLRYWKRPILKSNIGHNEYLITVACEGGLPLLLLRNENARLSRYFKQLLQTYHFEKQLPICDINAIARRLASYLPQSLHHEIVYNLGGDLIKQIVDLQNKVSDAVDPIIALDKNYPDWRNKLPLPLKDSTVELFIKNLVHEAKTLTLAEKQRIRWRRLLIRVGDEWRAEKRLELPNQFSGAVLKRRLNRDNLAPRFRILLQTLKDITPIALLTRLRGEGDEARYRCEALKRKGVNLAGVHALMGARLLISDGVFESDLEVNGGDVWGPLPWIFRERDGQWEYLREGSTRCREDNIRMLVPLNGILKATEGECVLIGSIPEIDREIWQCRGKILWTHPQLDTCRIVCGIQDARDEVLSLEGQRIYRQADNIPIFLGLPNVYAIGPDGGKQLLHLPMQWRPYTGGGLSWSNDLEACLGDVWLRCMDVDGTQLLRRRVHIVPKSFRVEIDQLSMDQEIGRIFLSGLDSGDVSCVAKSDCEFEIKKVSDGTFIYCLSDIGIPVTTFTAILYWTDGRSLEISLPFPQLGATFEFEGEVLPDNDLVPVTRLASVQAIVQAPLQGQTFDLHAKIKSSVYSLNQMWLREPIKVEEDGRGVFHLHRIQEKIASLLALSGELDAWAMIEILKPGDRCLARLKVAQFDMLLTPDKENQRVLLPESCLKRFEDRWEDRISIQMVPLWSPDREPIILKKYNDQAAWDVPENLESGPWWVLGEDGDWPRFRPLLWSQTGEATLCDSPLKRAIRQGDPEIRKQMYQNLLEEIAMDPNQPDWETFFNLIQLVRSYPASALDLFSTAINCPEVMVMALLRSGEEEFEAIWSLSSQLPFSWYLIPVNAWRIAATRYFGSFRVALADINGGEELVQQEFNKIRERVTCQRPFFQPICDWISHFIFPDHILLNSPLISARDYPNHIKKIISEELQNLQGRHDSEERYPEGPQIMRRTEQAGFPEQYKYENLAKPFRPIRCAPFVAAHVSLEGEAYDEKLMFELKFARDFDNEWFNTAYAFALCLGLSKTMTK